MNYTYPPPSLSRGTSNNSYQTGAALAGNQYNAALQGYANAENAYAQQTGAIEGGWRK